MTAHDKQQTPSPSSLMGLQKIKDTLKPLADAVFNDNGDMTVSVPSVSAEECIQAYFAVRQIDAAMRQTASPLTHVMWSDRLDEATRRKLREALRFAASRSVMSAEDELRILLALDTATPQIKKLKWKDGTYQSIATTPFIRYSVRLVDDDTGEHWSMGVDHFGSTYSRRDTLEEIKAAAQSDYETRIRAALATATEGQING